MGLGREEASCSLCVAHASDADDHTRGAGGICHSNTLAYGNCTFPALTCCALSCQYPWRVRFFCIPTNSILNRRLCGEFYVGTFLFYTVQDNNSAGLYRNFRLIV